MNQFERSRTISTGIAPSLISDELLGLKNTLPIEDDNESKEKSIINPKNYETLKRKDSQLAEVLNNLGYKVIAVDPCPANVFDILRNNRQRFSEMSASKNPPVWINQEGVKEYPRFYHAELEDGFFLQRENGMGIMNANIPPSMFHEDIRPSYKVTLRCNLGNDMSLPIEEIDIYVNDIDFFNAFDEVPNDQIDSVASMSFTQGVGKYYIGDQKIDTRVYFNYLLFKKDNMQQRRGGDAPSSKQGAKYSKLSFRNFYANIWQIDDDYTLSTEEAKTLSEER